MVDRAERQKQGFARVREALESLCQIYWYPIYAFVRGAGRSPPDAQDLTQEFFVRLLTRDFLHLVTPEKGRFRTFLRTALKRFLANEWDRAHAQKRGGGAIHVSFDTALAEKRLGWEQAGMLAPDRSYDLRWALTLLDEAIIRLENEYNSAGNTDLWRQLWCRAGISQPDHCTLHRDGDVRHRVGHLRPATGGTLAVSVLALPKTEFQFEKFAGKPGCQRAGQKENAGMERVFPVRARPAADAGLLVSRLCFCASQSQK